MSDTAASDPAADAVLDARDLKCPLPVLRARKALKGMAPGQVLRVDASDPDSLADFRSFCAVGAADLVEQRTDPDGLIRHWLRARPGEAETTAP